MLVIECNVRQLYVKHILPRYSENSRDFTCILYKWQKWRALQDWLHQVIPFYSMNSMLNPYAWHTGAGGIKLSLRFLKVVWVVPYISSNVVQPVNKVKIKMNLYFFKVNQRQSMVWYHTRAPRSPPALHKG